MYKQPYPSLFKPIKIRNTMVKNRIMSAPNLLIRTIGGRPDEYYRGYIEHKARGGAGIVTLGEANVCDGGNHQVGMETTLENMPIFSEMAHVIHQYGAIASVELTHGGERANPQYNKDAGLIMGPCERAPGVVADSYAHLNHPKWVTHRAAIDWPCKAMDKADMEYVANGYADTAEYYMKAGFDTVLVHCGSGWLLTQFISPLTNKRTDEYGGSLENRMRFPLYVLKTIRERVGPQKPLLIRLSGTEGCEGGYTIEDMTTFLSKAQEYIDMAEITTEAAARVMATTFMPHGLLVDLADTIKKSGRVNIPVYSIGSILDPEHADRIIASGAADGVSMSRALIADPFLPKKTLTGREDDVTPCLRCLNCSDSDNRDRHFICSVNPLISREARLGFGDSLEPAKCKKTVLIIGGGLAGLQAAITASARGHEVTLVERTGELGGMLRFSYVDSLKHDLRRYTDYMIRKANVSGAKILLNTEVTDSMIESINPDSIMIATGSEPIVPKIKGIENARHVTDIYFDTDFKPGDHVVIIGGGLVGVEAALHLNNIGKTVTVLEKDDDIIRDARGVYRGGLTVILLEKPGIKIVISAKVSEITASGVIYEQDGNSVTAPADTVLYAVGMRSNDVAYLDLYDKAPFVTLIGDAKKNGKVHNAVHSAYYAAIDL